MHVPRAWNRTAKHFKVVLERLLCSNVEHSLKIVLIDDIPQHKESVDMTIKIGCNTSELIRHCYVRVCEELFLRLQNFTTISLAIFSLHAREVWGVLGLSRGSHHSCRGLLALLTTTQAVYDSMTESTAGGNCFWWSRVHINAILSTSLPPLTFCIILSLQNWFGNYVA